MQCIKTSRRSIDLKGQALDGFDEGACEVLNRCFARFLADGQASFDDL